MRALLCVVDAITRHGKSVLESSLKYLYNFEDRKPAIRSVACIPSFFIMHVGYSLAGDDVPSSNTLSDSVERGERRRRTQSRPLRWQTIGGCERWQMLPVE